MRIIKIRKLPNGSELKQAKVQAKIVKPVVELSEVTKPNSDTSAPPQSDAAPSLLSDTKKEKKKKNKRINKSSETARTTSAETNMEVQQETQARTQTVSPPKLVRETEEKDKEEASANVQSAKKSKKDRWRNRRNKNANSKDEQLVSEATNQALNGDSEGNDHSQDEKKVDIVVEFLFASLSFCVSLLNFIRLSYSWKKLDSFRRLCMYFLCDVFSYGRSTSRLPGNSSYLFYRSVREPTKALLCQRSLKPDSILKTLWNG